MPAQRLTMRQVREVLRLKHAAGLSERGIAASLSISRTTVTEYLRRSAVVGITWPVPDELDDAALERRLFSPPFAEHESPRPQLCSSDQRRDCDAQAANASDDMKFQGSSSSTRLLG